MKRDTLEVSIDHGDRDIHVGEILACGDGTTRFALSQSYLALGPDRPLVSLSWFDTKGDRGTISRLTATQDKIGPRGRLPDWFAGLLPEGALREIVELDGWNGKPDDFDILRRLGNDLPGAVRVGDGYPVEPDHSGSRIRFSLAGVQLKFSMEKASDGRFCYPASGLGGDHILKTPSNKHPDIVEAEVLAMRLADAVGIHVADTSMVPVSEVSGIQGEYLVGGGNVLVSRRFDRQDSGRIHIEDFAQISNAVGDLKYTRGGYDLVKRIVGRFSTSAQEDTDEVVRRTVNDLLVGNSDNHLKNWSFIFDGSQRRLSPAYDIVPYRAYGDGTLAGPIGGQTNIDDVSINRFLRFLGNDERSLAVAKETVTMALDTWPGIVMDIQLEDTIGKFIVRRAMVLPIAKEILSASLGSNPGFTR